MIKDVLAVRDVKTHCPLCGRSFARVEFDEEHIFPKWLQHHHDLWTRRLTIPNFVGKNYKSVKIKICKTCNNKRYGNLEAMISDLLRVPDPYAALVGVDVEDLAIWLGKISWLLCRKSHSVEDFRSRNEPKMSRILSEEIITGTLYLGMMERAFAMKKEMHSCYAGDPPHPPLYGSPYSLYRFRIDTRDSQFETFDFVDNPVVLGAAIRSNNVGLFCVFDGGLHQLFRSHRFEFLINEALHPMQFNEVVAQTFYDQTVLDERACQVTYYWNTRLNSVIAQTHTPRSYNPYLEANHDQQRLVSFLGRYTFTDPSALTFAGGTEVFTSLKDHDGAFLPYAVTDGEIEAARCDPNQIVLGPLASAWRQKPTPE